MQIFPATLQRILIGVLLIFTGAIESPAAHAQSGQATPGRTRIQLVDRIIAVVNQDVITRFELSERLQRVTRELEQRNTPLPPRDVLERQVLERLIVERAQLQRAAEIGLRVDDEQLDVTVTRVAESNNMTPAQLRQALERDNVPMQKFREELRNEIVLSRLREREVDNRISISENEVDLYLAEQSEGRETASEFDLSHILIRVPEQATPEQLDRQRARAEEVVKRARGGDDFAQLSASFSDAAEAMAGGELGWRPRDRIPDLYFDALSKLAPGQVSDVLRSPAGFHVFRLNNMRGSGSPLMIEQTRARHILLRVGEAQSEAEARRKLENLRERIVNGVDFGEMAKLNSDDGSAGAGGALGWLYPGDTVPEFERAMNDLKVGELSQPVRSPFGLHLIQVQERQIADMSTERRRLEARKALREKKSEEAFQEWVRQLRDRAYVELRMEDR
ncbi:MAG: molecular chaperone SurA [Betaproteobacteria bacterium]|nr:molecular chaperone SurA [Betaproteobacteria bacterium]